MRAPIGTDAYMAPEQRAPDGRLGAARRRLRARRDAVHAALTGATWRACGTAAGGCRAAPPLPRRTPAALADVVRAGLDPDPAARARPPREFASALEPLVAALPRRLTLGRRS